MSSFGIDAKIRNLFMKEYKWKNIHSFMLAFVQNTMYFCKKNVESAR